MEWTAIGPGASAQATWLLDVVFCLSSALSILECFADDPALLDARGNRRAQPAQRDFRARPASLRWKICADTSITPCNSSFLVQAAREAVEQTAAAGGHTQSVSCHARAPGICFATVAIAPRFQQQLFPRHVRTGCGCQVGNWVVLIKRIRLLSKAEVMSRKVTTQEK